MTQVVTPEPPRRGRGRPKGSRNRPKAIAVAAERPAGPGSSEKLPRPSGPAGESDSACSPAALSAPGGTSLLEQYRETARRLENALSTETDGKLIASLSTTLNRTRWHIGQLSGEAAITESKIVRTDAWRNIVTRLEQILGKYPEAAAELAAYFESLETT